jgi:hypothetical protein
VLIRRTCTVVSLFSIALFVYCLLCWGAVRRLLLVACPEIHAHHVEPWHPRADEDPIFGIAPSDVPTHFDIAGIRIPISALIAAWLTIQFFPFLVAFANHRRRRRRFLDDECLECGRPITEWRGRCPGCGVRIGPG